MQFFSPFKPFLYPRTSIIGNMGLLTGGSKRQLLCLDLKLADYCVESR